MYTFFSLSNITGKILSCRLRKVLKYNNTRDMWHFPKNVDCQEIIKGVI